MPGARQQHSTLYR